LQVKFDLFNSPVLPAVTFKEASFKFVAPSASNAVTFIVMFVLLGPSFGPFCIAEVIFQTLRISGEFPEVIVMFTLTSAELTFPVGVSFLKNLEVPLPTLVVRLIISKYRE